jgi:3-deoxy-D-arabino-heptulosonate 7-phosphate (DAHP) synthase class II
MEQIKQFVKDLDGRFKHHISDEFMIAYLIDEFENKRYHHPSRLIENTAYAASLNLFENLLEHGCKEIMNGHHVAQKFSTYFKD